MSAPLSPSRPAALVFAAFVICSIAFAFSLGHLTGRCASVGKSAREPELDRLAEMHQLLIQTGQTVRQSDFFVLESALEQHKALAPAEHSPIIDDCLRVLRNSYEEHSTTEIPTAMAHSVDERIVEIGLPYLRRRLAR